MTRLYIIVPEEKEMNAPFLEAATSAIKDGNIYINDWSSGELIKYSILAYEINDITEV